MSNDFIDVIIKGVARDAHPKYPIRFDYSKSGKAYLVGCRVEAEVETAGGKKTKRGIEIKAFDEQAEELAHITDGTRIHVRGRFEMQKANNGQFYPVCVVTQVYDAGFGGIE